MFRLLMLVVVLAGAVVFDLCHTQELDQLATQQSEAGKHKLDNQVFFYNPGSSFKIRTGTDKLFSKILFTIGQDKFLAAFHNQKAFDLIKSESLKVGAPLNPMVHFMKFIICHHAASDDNCPLS